MFTSATIPHRSVRLVEDVAGDPPRSVVGGEDEHLAVRFGGSSSGRVNGLLTGAARQCVGDGVTGHDQFVDGERDVEVDGLEGLLVCPGEIGAPRQWAGSSA